MNYPGDPARHEVCSGSKIKPVTRPGALEWVCDCAPLPSPSGFPGADGIGYQDLASRTAQARVTEPGRPLRSPWVLCAPPGFRVPVWKGADCTHIRPCPRANPAARPSSVLISWLRRGQRPDGRPASVCRTRASAARSWPWGARCLTARPGRPALCRRVKSPFRSRSRQSKAVSGRGLNQPPPLPTTARGAGAGWGLQGQGPCRERPPGGLEGLAFRPRAGGVWGSSCQ